MLDVRGFCVGQGVLVIFLNDPDMGSVEFVRERGVAAEEKFRDNIILEGRGRVPNARAVRQATFIQKQGGSRGEMTDAP